MLIAVLVKYMNISSSMIFNEESTSVDWYTVIYVICLYGRAISYISHLNSKLQPMI